MREKKEPGLVLPDQLSDDPMPEVSFKGKCFVFTGEFADRSGCEWEVTDRDGKVSKKISKEVDYLVIGSVASPQWRNPTRGGKIDDAERYRKKYKTPTIISECQFLDAIRKATS